MSQLDPSNNPQPISLRSILIPFSHLRLGLPSGLFPSGFPTKTFYTFLSSSMRATCPAHLILLDMICLMIYVLVQCEDAVSALCSIAQQLIGKLENWRENCLYPVKSGVLTVGSKDANSGLLRSPCSLVWGLRFTGTYHLRLRRLNSFLETTTYWTVDCRLVVVMGWDCRLSTAALGLLFYPRVTVMWTSE
jgi:hypothetical protein